MHLDRYIHADTPLLRVYDQIASAKCPKSPLLSNYGCPGGFRRSQVPRPCATSCLNSASSALLSTSCSESSPSSRAGSSAASMGSELKLLKTPLMRWSAA